MKYMDVFFKMIFTWKYIKIMFFFKKIISDISALK